MKQFIGACRHWASQARFKGFKDLHRHYMAIKVARKKNICVVLSHCWRDTFVALVNALIQHLFRIQFHIALLDWAVSKLLVKLPRTVKRSK